MAKVILQVTAPGRVTGAEMVSKELQKTAINQRLAVLMREHGR